MALCPPVCGEGRLSAEARGAEAKTDCRATLQGCLSPSGPGCAWRPDEVLHVRCRTTRRVCVWNVRRFGPAVMAASAITPRRSAERLWMRLIFWPPRVAHRLHHSGWWLMRRVRNGAAFPVGAYCTVWYAITSRRSAWSRWRYGAARGCRGSRRRSFAPTCAVGGWRPDSRASGARRAARTGSRRPHARVVVSVRVRAPR